MTTKKIFSFEAALKKLQEITEELEDNDLPLEKAISKYEEGVHLAKQCEEFLQNMEQRVEIISKNSDGSIKSSLLTTSDEDSAGE